MPSFPVPVLSFLSVSFRPSLFRSHSCSTGACLPLSPSAFPLLFPLSFVRFFSGSDYSACCSSFPLFPVSPLSGCPGARFRFRFFAFPFLSSLISHAFLPGSRTRLSVCFLSPFPDSLTQLFLRCLPHAFAFGLSAFLPLSFVRFRSASGYSALCFFRSPLPGLASQWLFQCFGSSFRLPRFPPSLPPGLPCFCSWLRYWAFCSFPFILPGFAPTAVPQVFPFDCSLGRVLDFRFST